MAYSGETKQDRAKGKDVRTSNIVAAKAVANAIRTSLGPRGMDKMMQLADGQVLISNDGATVLQKLKVIHPAAKMLVELSQSQDKQAGDGTTTVVVLAGALLEACSGLLNKGLHPTQIASSFLSASDAACATLTNHMAHPIQLWNKSALLSAVETCLSSKVVHGHADILAPIAVDSVLALLPKDQLAQAQADYEQAQAAGTTPKLPQFKVDLSNIRIVEQLGGTVEDCELVHGLVLTKGSAKAASGAPTRMSNAKVALIQYCLSAPKTDMDNNVIVSDYTAMDRILREERKYILNQCKTIKKSGANVLLIQKSILRDAYNELSLHFLAKMGILVVTDIERGDVDFICKTLGCKPIAHPDQCTPDKLGTCDQVQDVFVEGSSSRVVQFTGIQGNKTSEATPTVTVVLRGSNEWVLQEAARSLHDAQCVVRSLVQQPALIAGGGAAEMHVAVELQKQAKSLQGMDAYCQAAYAEAITSIPFILAENAGLSAVQVVTELRNQHAAGNVNAGINIKKGGVVQDMYALDIVQPLLVSTSAFSLASETVAMMMKIDDLIVVQ